MCYIALRISNSHESLPARQKDPTHTLRSCTPTCVLKNGSKLCISLRADEFFHSLSQTRRGARLISPKTVTTMYEPSHTMTRIRSKFFQLITFFACYYCSLMRFGLIDIGKIDLPKKNQPERTRNDEKFSPFANREKAKKEQKHGKQNR